MKIFPILFLFLSFSLRAMEISCESDSEYYAKSDIVFYGQVIDRVAVVEDDDESICWTQSSGPKCGSKIATFKISEILKGAPTDSVKVMAGDGCYCVSPYLEMGESYVVFAKFNKHYDSVFSLNGCATRPMSPVEFSEIKKKI
ncbi:hypothetical protein [Microbulbifer guangxiensis]|uniref:hypothetical protein n=1 Tax=Microbulbifer guangxiensis TaxID=2904249 RepID=UPI001F2136D3|nr:hypothetical protein [Microbulbifer guangxiensis]